MPGLTAGGRRGDVKVTINWASECTVSYRREGEEGWTQAGSGKGGVPLLIPQMLPGKYEFRAIPYNERSIKPDSGKATAEVIAMETVEVLLGPIPRVIKPTYRIKVKVDDWNTVPEFEKVGISVTYPSGRYSETKYYHSPANAGINEYTFDLPDLTIGVPYVIEPLFYARNPYATTWPRRSTDVKGVNVKSELKREMRRQDPYIYPGGYTITLTPEEGKSEYAEMTITAKWAKKTYLVKDTNARAKVTRTSENSDSYPFNRGKYLVFAGQEEVKVKTVDLYYYAELPGLYLWPRGKNEEVLKVQLRVGRDHATSRWIKELSLDKSNFTYNRNSRLFTPARSDEEKTTGVITLKNSLSDDLPLVTLKPGEGLFLYLETRMLNTYAVLQNAIIVGSEKYVLKTQPAPVTKITFS